MRTALIAALASALLVLVGGASGAAAPSGDWTGFGRTTDNMRHSPLTQITPANVAATRPRVHDRLPRGRPGHPPWRTVLPACGRGHALRDDERCERVRDRRGDRQDPLALQARQQRPLQELRDRREPRPRLLRRRALPAHARHASEQAEPDERRAPRPGRDRRRPCPAPARTTATPRRARRSARTTA